jgi:2-dehydropantoate 2-reductase
MEAAWYSDYATSQAAERERMSATMSRYDFEYAILGAGAMGSIIGAHLARAGHRVVLLARERRAQQIEQQGLRLKGLADFTEHVPVLSDATQLRAAEVLIVATKTHATERALAPLREARIEVAFSVQNGLMKNDQLLAVFGAAHVLGALANISGELLATGEVLFTRNERLCVGELDGRLSERAQRIAATIDAAGVRTSAVADVLSLEWSKFASWVGMMALSVTTRAVSWKYLTDPDCALVIARLVREVGMLAQASGSHLSDQSMLPVASLCRDSDAGAVATIVNIGRAQQLKAPQHRMSTLQDLEAARSLEVEETLGYAAARAAALKLQLPLLDSFYHLIAGIDHSSRQRP